MPDSYPVLAKTTSSTSGLGNYVLGIGSVTGYRTFKEAVADGDLTTGDTVVYVARDTTASASGNLVEHGEGVYNDAANTITRTASKVFQGSNGAGALVNWLSGSRDIYVELAVDRLARLDRINTFSAVAAGGANFESAGAVQVRFDTPIQNRRLVALDGPNVKTQVFLNDTTVEFKVGPTEILALSVADSVISVPGSGSGPQINIGNSIDNSLPALVLSQPDRTWVVYNRGDIGDEFHIQDLTGVKTPFKISPGVDNDLLYIKAAEVVVNDSETDVDFRVAGNTETNLLFCDAGTDRVGVGVAVPLGRLEVRTGAGSGIGPPSKASEIVASSNVECGISIMGGNATENSLNFGSLSDSSGAKVSWQHSTQEMKIGPTGLQTSTLGILSGVGTEMARFHNNALTGGVGLIIAGTTLTNTSVGLELGSTTRAVLVSRMTTTQRNSLTAVNGMIVYNSTVNQMQGYINGAWAAM